MSLPVDFGLVVVLELEVVLVVVALVEEVEVVVAVVVDGDVDDVKFCENFDLVVLSLLSPPSVRGVSSCAMLIVVIVVVACSGVGLYAVSWLVCSVVSSSRQKLAGSITLIKLHAWCHLCGSL